MASSAAERIAPRGETMLTIVADPKHLGARIGITSVLHSWGSALTHHRLARNEGFLASSPNATRLG